MHKLQQMRLSLIIAIVLSALVACNKADNTAKNGETNSVPASEAVAPSNAVKFIATQDDKPFVIEAALFDTPAAKEFLATGKNLYIGNTEAIAKGKKVFGMYSCTQCHGPEAKGQVGPGLVGPTFKYPKDATNKGMFETVWHGTNGGMGAKGIGLMDATDPKNGITPDELLKVIAWIRTHGSEGLTGNE